MNAPPAAWRVYAFIFALTGLVVLLGWLALRWEDPVDWEAVLVLSALGALGTNLREREFADGLGVSFTAVVLAAAMVLAGPTGAVVVGFLSFIFDFRASSLQNYLFNATMAALMSGAGSAVYVSLGETDEIGPETGPLELFTEVAVPMVVGYLVSIAVNALLIGLMVRIKHGKSALAVAAGVVRSLGPGYMVHVLLAILLVLLWQPVGVGPFSAALIVIPLLLTQWALSRDAAERRSHTRTVSTLMGALEVATPYSSGHSSRVAELADRMAPGLGIAGESADSLHFAALLHDLGLVSSSPRVPRGTGPSDVSYLAAIQEHPEAGVHMLADIDFLAPALPGILHHHERYDGLGYPAGLIGEKIPLFARVIAVADAFDSLTTNRSYRNEVSGVQALAQLRERSGTHLDPVVVQALAESLEEQPWEPTRISEAMLQSAVDLNDHDDPSVSDEYAAWQPETDEVRA